MLEAQSIFICQGWQRVRLTLRFPLSSWDEAKLWSSFPLSSMIYGQKRWFFTTPISLLGSSSGCRGKGEMTSSAIFHLKDEFLQPGSFFLCIWPLSFSAMIRFRKQMQTVKLFSVRFCREPPGCGLIVCNWCNSLYNGKYLFHLQTGDLDNTTVGLFVNLFYHYHCQTVNCPPSYWRRKSQAQEWCANCFCLFFIMQDKHVWLNFFFLFFHFRLFE